MTGFIWDGKYRVTCPDGKVFDGTRRVERPAPQANECAECGSTFYVNRRRVGNIIRLYCNKACACAARNRRDAGLPRARRVSKQRDYSECKGHRARTDKYGGDYVIGITAQGVAARDGMKCQMCGSMVQPHRGGWHPEGWSIGHIVPLSHGGDHTWENVQCECIQCNLAKGTKAIGQLNMAI